MENEYQNSGWNYTGNVDIRFDPSGNVTFKAGASGGSGSIDYQWKGYGYIWSYISYQQKLLDKKLELNLSLSDPFNKYHAGKSEQFDRNFYLLSKRKMPTRTLNITLSYNFGQMKNKVKKAKTSIRNDDLKTGD